jgi:uncharacterized protein YgiM (DUF1202 family)
MYRFVIVRRAAVLLVLAALAFSLVAPALAQGIGSGQITNASRVNLRSGPGAGYPVVTILFNGQLLTVLGRNVDNSWVQVQLIGGTTGWVNARYVATSVPVGNLNVNAQTGSNSAFVTSSFLNLRAGPGANFQDLGTIGFGQALNLIGRNADNSWVQVNIPGGAQGAWVSARYISSGTPIGWLPLVSNTGIFPTFPQPVPTSGQTGIVTAGNLNVRFGPGAWFGAFDRLHNGEGVSLIGRNGNATWLLVQLANGTTGWVSSSFILTAYPIGALEVRA